VPHKPATRLAASRALRAALPFAAALLLGGCSSEPRRETLSHGRFEPIALSVPSDARSLVLMLSGPGDAARADELSAELSRQRAIVARIDAAAFQRVLDDTSSGCVFPSGDLDNLAHYIQAYLKQPRYAPAILIGVGAGGAITETALAQSPPSTFAGALVFDGCQAPPLRAPACPRESASSEPSSGTDAVAPPSPGAPADPLLRVHSNGGPCATEAAPARAEAAFADAFTTLVRAADTHATSATSDLPDIPIIEVLSNGNEYPDAFGVFLSGDGGWAGIDAQLSARLARRGLPIVGIDSLRYFWHARTPQSTSADVARVIERYSRVWRRPRALLIGFSQGADVLPFVLNRLPEETRPQVVGAVALSLSTTATFEFHVSNWIGASGDRPTAPETDQLVPNSLTCVYGKEDHDALCPRLDRARFHVVELPGSHHFNGDYDRLSTIVLGALAANSALVIEK
jgi:type IV secretory pathway VirJ component